MESWSAPRSPPLSPPTPPRRPTRSWVRVDAMTHATGPHFSQGDAHPGTSPGSPWRGTTSDRVIEQGYDLDDSQIIITHNVHLHGPWHQGNVGKEVTVPGSQVSV